MSMEIRRGAATAIVKGDKQNSVECRIGASKVMLHGDLERIIKEGDDILVAGELREDVLHALAVKNMTQDRTLQIDGSNYTLVIGVGLFFWILGFVLGMQYLGAGNTTLATLNGCISLAGFVLGIWAFMQVLRIRRAGLRITYGAERR
jgi:hypothetical protein